MAYNPYALADTFTQLAESEQEAKRMGQESRIGTALKKQDIKKEYEGKLAEAHKRAQEVLQKQMSKRSKGRGWLKKLVSIALPGVGAIWSGIDAAKEGKRAGKHALDMAELAKKYALDVDPTGRFANLFTGDSLADYKRVAEKDYGDIVSQAQIQKDKLSDPTNMLKTALATGITSYGAGKAMKAGMGKLKGIKPFTKGEGILKDVKSLKKAGISGDTFKDILKSPVATDTPIDVSTITEDIDPKMVDLIKQLGPETAGGVDISKLLDAKSPFFKLLKEAGKTGVQTQKKNPLGFESKDSTDTLTALLQMLQFGGMR